VRLAQMLAAKRHGWSPLIEVYNPIDKLASCDLDVDYEFDIYGT